MKAYKIKFESGNSYYFYEKNQLLTFKNFEVPFEIEEVELEGDMMHKVRKMYSIYHLNFDLYKNWIYDIKKKEIYIHDMNEIFFTISY